MGLVQLSRARLPVIGAGLGAIIVIFAIAGITFRQSMRSQGQTERTVQITIEQALVAPLDPIPTSQLPLNATLSSHYRAEYLRRAAQHLAKIFARESPMYRGELQGVTQALASAGTLRTLGGHVRFFAFRSVHRAGHTATATWSAAVTSTQEGRKSPHAPWSKPDKVTDKYTGSTTLELSHGRWLIVRYAENWIGSE